MPAPPQLITCPKCLAVLGAELFNLPDLQPCPSCHIPVQVEVFPALFREEEVNLETAFMELTKGITA